MKPAWNVNFLSTVSLLDTRLVKLNLHKTIQGSIVLSCNVVYPEGTVFFNSTPELVVEFLTANITLQSLFDRSFILPVEIIYEGKTERIMPKDGKIILSGGNKNFKEIFDFDF